MTEAAILSLTAQRGSALIGRFAGITGQTTSYTPTPSGPSYGVGMNFFCCCAHQGCKKSAGIKLLVNNGMMIRLFE